MLELRKVTSLRLERQYLIVKSGIDNYDELYKELQPGLNVYWNGFGDPPSLSFRTDFNDIEYNRKRQLNRILRKGRFSGGNLGWVLNDDFELFACLYKKPINKYNEKQEILLEMIKNEGPMNIHQMKEYTGLLTKEITPALHRLQKAFLIYEDQYDGEWDRAWYKIAEIFPDLNSDRYSKEEALQKLLLRFLYRNVIGTIEMIKSYFKVPVKSIKNVVEEMVNEKLILSIEDKYILKSDLDILENYHANDTRQVLALHRNDFLVKSNEDTLKKRYFHQKYDTLQYLLIDGEIKGAVVGKFRYGPNEIEDIILDDVVKFNDNRFDEILEAVALVNQGSEIVRMNGIQLKQ